MDLQKTIDISASGMKAQTSRLKIIAENMANAESGPSKPGAEPYRRKTISFKNEMDRQEGIHKVKIAGIGQDKTPFRMKFDPGNPMADQQGYIQLPNVNSLIEMADMKEAQRSYEANLGMIETSRSMMRQTLDLLK
jgi:flagellar basal-body rod protein FlgC